MNKQIRIRQIRNKEIRIEDTGNRRVVIDLSALAQNFRQLSKRIAPAECGAVVKANAYGLGAVEVAQALAVESCKRFFVATADEAFELSAALPDLDVYVMEGLSACEIKEVGQRSIWPVLNTLEQVELWASAIDYDSTRRCCLHLDSGMNRLGMGESELSVVCADERVLDKLNIDFVMTHLACSDEANHPQNDTQLAIFDRLRRQLPSHRSSIVCSAGVFLSKQFYGDLARPGIALFGGNLHSDSNVKMKEVVKLQGRVLQIRLVERDGAVGYGATTQVKKGARLATIAMGYADGYHRSLGGKASAMIGTHQVPLIGRVSMDYVVLDVSTLAESEITVGDWATLIGGGIDIDILATQAGTISYELLTGLGRRVTRRYLRN